MSETPSARERAIDVFRYLDHRVFLADVYKALKQKGLSYRAFSRRAGLGAPNYLKLVIDGQRNLTPAMAARFAEACGLSGESTEYFVGLTAFCQATTATEKSTHYARLLAHRRYREAHRLDVSHAAYHASWYMPAIRELVATRDFEEDPHFIARTLVPAISAREAQRALRILLELGLLVRNEQGRLQQTTAVVSTGPETVGLHIVSYHAEMLERARAAMELVPAAERDISSLTLTVSHQGLLRLKRRIQEMRRELLELAESETERTQVVQLNMQLFPLSQHVPKGRVRTPSAARGRRAPKQGADDGTL